jgi:hypothetical protein
MPKIRETPIALVTKLLFKYNQVIGFFVWLSAILQQSIFLLLETRSREECDNDTTE